MTPGGSHRQTIPHDFIWHSEPHGFKNQSLQSNNLKSKIEKDKIKIWKNNFKKKLCSIELSFNKANMA